MAGLPKTPGGLSPAANDLGLGSMLQDQVVGETEEQRKKRMAQMALSGFQPPGTAGPSPASLALFGGMGGLNNR